MRFLRKNYGDTQRGFTLVEIVVATGIFAMVITSILTLLSRTLQINRRVQALREVSAGTRSLTEIVSRTVRNGRIDYNSPYTECSVAAYSSPKQALGIETRAGDKLCFYLDVNGTLWLKKKVQGVDTAQTVFDPSKFKIDPATFHFYIKPLTDPQDDNNPPAVQPIVTMVSQFQLLDPTGGSNSTIIYQTTISTDVYDILHKK